MVRFVYEPLPSINQHGQTPPFTRLVLVEPGTSNQPLRVHLQLIDVTNSPLKYEALSYVWGTERAANPVICGQGHLAMTLNLERALHGLRLPSLTRCLWIDAISIDQSNLGERARQVDYMRLVYQHAARVIVWFGPDTPLMQRAFHRAGELCAYRATLLEAHGPILGSEVQNQVELMVIEAFVAPTESESAASLTELFQSPYFERVWCVQEVVASEHAIAKSGHLEMDMYDLLSLAKCVNLAQLHDARVPVFPPGPLQFWNVIHRQRNRSYYPNAVKVPRSLGKIGTALMSIRDLKATDDRDRIFAVLGITDEGLEPVLAIMDVYGDHDSRWLSLAQRGIMWLAEKANSSGPGIDVGRHPALKADYGKPIIEVYRDFTRFMLRKPPRVLDILSHVQHTGHVGRPVHTQEYPSWVPRFNVPRSVSYFPSELFLAGIPYTGHFRYFAELYDMPLRGGPQQPNVLQLDGFVFDEVVAVTQPVDFRLPDDPPIQLLWDQLFSVPLFPRPGLMYVCDNEQTDVSFLMTMYAGPIGAVVSSYLAEELEHLGGRQQGIQRLLQSGKNNLIQWLSQTLGDAGMYQDLIPAQMSPSEQRPGDAYDYKLGTWSMSLNRRLYRTRAGYLGLGPSVMRRGDVVSVLFGGHMPFIMRRDQSEWLLVGDTYLHSSNLMNGHLVDRVRRGKEKYPTVTFGVV
jgi:hypothetical protein